jgi:ATP-dependent Clp protease ATP-binding subunit ClpA
MPTRKRGGGQLTNALRANPRAVVLLDEIEKADSQVHRVFLPVFDEGYLADAKNEVVSCQHTLFILTSNLCAREIQHLRKAGCSFDEIKQAIEPILMQTLSPELCNRMELVLFNPVDRELMGNLVDLMLSELKADVLERKGMTLLFDDSVKHHLVEVGYHPELGARYLKQIIEKELVGALAKKVVAEELSGSMTLRIFYHPVHQAFSVKTISL